MRALLVGSRCIAGLLTALCACSCKPGQHPFLLVQLCLGNVENVVAFRDVVRLIAESEHMEYIDSSAEELRGLQAANAPLAFLREPNDYLGLWVNGEHGIGLGAGNLGLSSYEVAIGFSEGDAPLTAHVFADRAVARLAQQWKVVPTKEGAGAFPLPGCAPSTSRDAI